MRNYESDGVLQYSDGSRLSCHCRIEQSHTSADFGDGLTSAMEESERVALLTAEAAKRAAFDRTDPRQSRQNKTFT
jgi:hypothetical protein